MKFILLMIAAYLAGSVNFSIILFRLLGKEDPRTLYSGNAGTTNVYRQAGPIWAAVVLLLDVGRAAVVALVAKYFLTPGQIPWMGLALIVGNSHPCFHGFKGGKGVANYLGFTAVLSPYGAIASCVAWVIVYLIKRVPFIASFAMIAILCAATIMACGYEGWAFIGATATALFIVWNHRENISSAMKERKREIAEKRGEGEDADEE